MNSIAGRATSHSAGKLISNRRINAKLTKIWETHAPSRVRYVHMHYGILQPGAVIFVGLNPSFSQSGWQSVLKHSTDPKLKSLKPDKFFRWPVTSDFNIATSLKLERLAREHHSFYRPHRDLANFLGHECGHIDLFAIRLTSQNAIKRLIFSASKTLTLNEFALDQFKVFEALLETTKPAAVIVVNALASRIYANQRKPEPDANAGVYRDSIGEHSFPVFFSGMTTGSRALDRYSKQRLFWQVGKTLGQQWSEHEFLSLVNAAGESKTTNPRVRRKPATGKSRKKAAVGKQRARS